MAIFPAEKFICQVRNNTNIKRIVPEALRDIILVIKIKATEVSLIVLWPTAGRAAFLNSCSNNS